MPRSFSPHKYLNSCVCLCWPNYCYVSPPCRSTCPWQTLESPDASSPSLRGPWGSLANACLEQQASGWQAIVAKNGSPGPSFGTRPSQTCAEQGCRRIRGIGWPYRAQIVPTGHAHRSQRKRCSGYTAGLLSIRMAESAYLRRKGAIRILDAQNRGQYGARAPAHTQSPPRGRNP